MGVRHRQQRGGVGGMGDRRTQPARFQRRQQRGKARELRRGMRLVGLVGGGEVREDAFHRQPVKRSQRRQQRRRGVRAYAQPVHARVHLDVDGEPLPDRPCRDVQRRRRLHLEDRQRDRVRQRVCGVPERRVTQHQDRARNPGLAQLKRLRQRGDCKAIGAGSLQNTRCLRRTVTIGIGLDDSHQLRSRRQPRSQQMQVVCQRAPADFKPGRARWEVLGAMLRQFTIHNSPFRLQLLFCQAGANSPDDGHPQRAANVFHSGHVSPSIPGVIPGLACP